MLIKPPKLRTQSGFTLVELTIALAIFSLVMLVMTVGVVQFFRIYDAGHQIRSTQESARTVAQDITNDAHRSIAMSTGSYSGRSTICLYTRYVQLNDTYNGNIYFVIGSPSQVREYPVSYTGASPTTDCPNASLSHIGTIAQVVSGVENVVPGFNPTVTQPPAGTAAQILTLDLSLAADAGKDLLQADPNNAGFFRCPGGGVSGYCSVTNLHITALNQVGSGS